ncbi:hypothetical protein M758_5G175300 [Ceratodon purpureus]|nr:hypothetical protein M758_5G175300 [Ceratodon purpureus]
MFSRNIVTSSPRCLGMKVDSESKSFIEEAEATTERTRAALEKIVEGRLSAAAQPKSVPSQWSARSFIKYTPSDSQQSAAYKSGANQRVIWMVEMPKDSLEPPKFKHKKVPKAFGAPPVPVLHSPPRPVTVKDQQDWKIPPCISNWKNPKGYTIPLDKRLATDHGRGLLQEVQVNDNFANLSEALDVAEHKAREAVEARSKIQHEVMIKENEKKENELRMLAQRARMERAGVSAATGANATLVAADRRGAVPYEWKADDARGSTKEEGMKETKEERQYRLGREALRVNCQRERERERRLEAKEGPVGKKSKITRDRDRDMSEKMALGIIANVGASYGELTYEQRLFNQEKGNPMESRLIADDSYNVYDKALFTSQSGLSGLYRPQKHTNHAEEVCGGDAGEQLDKVLINRFRPARKGFAGASERARPLDRPVEFEKDDVGEDPFGLDIFLTELKKGKKALDKVGEGGTILPSSARAGNKDSD